MMVIIMKTGGTTPRLELLMRINQNLDFYVEWRGWGYRKGNVEFIRYLVII